jgi:hypothetical protein
MARPIWLALILLIGICALAALKISIAAPPQQAAFADDVIELPVNALAKADKKSKKLRIRKRYNRLRSYRS